MRPVTRARPRLLAVPLVAIAAGVAGCGISDPYHHATRSSPASPPTSPAATATSAAPPGPSSTGASTAPVALARYAQLAINWTSRTLSRDQHQLADLSVGAARAQALQTAATYGARSSLQHSQVTNQGQVTAIARGRGPRAGDWVITTQENTGGQGDYAGLPAQAHVYYAQVIHTRHGWTVSTWSAQN